MSGVDGPHLTATAAGATHSGFDYGALAPDVADHARGAAAQIRELVKRTVGAIIETGDLLRSVKAKLEHGRFGEWLAAEFGMSERTAQRFIRAAEVFAGKSDTVSVLEPTALYLLSAPSTPERARQDALTRVERGEAMPVESVRVLVRMARAEARQVKEKDRANQRRSRRMRGPSAAEMRRKQELQAQRAEADAAAAELVDLLRLCLGDQAPRFLKLVEAADWFHTMRGIAKRVASEPAE